MNIISNKNEFLKLRLSEHSQARFELLSVSNFTAGNS